MHQFTSYLLYSFLFTRFQRNQEKKMEIASYRFNPEKQRVRKWWVWMTFALGSVNIILASFFPEATKNIWMHPTTPNWSTPLENKVAEILGSFLAYLLWIWINYHCIYRKYGTKFLTFQLIFAPIGYGIQTLVFFLSVFLYHALPRSVEMIALVVIQFSLFCIWYSYSLKIRNLNKNLVAILHDKDLLFIQSLQSPEKLPAQSHPNKLEA